MVHRVKLVRKALTDPPVSTVHPVSQVVTPVTVCEVQSVHPVTKVSRDHPDPLARLVTMVCKATKVNKARLVNPVCQDHPVNKEHQKWSIWAHSRMPFSPFSMS